MPTETYASELTRKSLETVERAALRHELGVLSDRDLRLVLDAVWDCVSGLVDEIEPIMNEAIGLTPEAVNTVMSDGRRVYLIGRKGLITTITDCLTRAEGSLKAHESEPDAVEHVRKLTLAFEQKGFKRL